MAQRRSGEFLEELVSRESFEVSVALSAYFAAVLRIMPRREVAAFFRVVPDEGLPEVAIVAVAFLGDSFLILAIFPFDLSSLSFSGPVCFGGTAKRARASSSALLAAESFS